MTNANKDIIVKLAKLLGIAAVSTTFTVTAVGPILSALSGMATTVLNDLLSNEVKNKLQGLQRYRNHDLQKAIIKAFELALTRVLEETSRYQLGVRRFVIEEVLQNYIDVFGKMSGAKSEELDKLFEQHSIIDVFYLTGTGEETFNNVWMFCSSVLSNLPVANHMSIKAIPELNDLLRQTLPDLFLFYRNELLKDDNYQKAWKGFIDEALRSVNDTAQELSTNFDHAFKGYVPIDDNFICIEELKAALNSKDAQPEKYYRFKKTVEWLGVIKGWDYSGGEVFPAILDDLVASEDKEFTTPALVIKGHSGSGKSVVMRRLALELKKKQRITYWVKDLVTFCEQGKNMLATELSLNQYSYLLIDNIDSVNYERFNDLMDHLSEHSKLIVVVSAKNGDMYNLRCNKIISVADIYDKDEILKKVLQNVSEDSVIYAWANNLLKKNHFENTSVFYLLYVILNLSADEMLSTSAGDWKREVKLCMERDLKNIAEHDPGVASSLISLAALSMIGCQVSAEVFTKLSNNYEESDNYTHLFGKADAWEEFDRLIYLDKDSNRAGIVHVKFLHDEFARIITEMMDHLRNFNWTYKFKRRDDYLSVLFAKIFQMNCDMATKSSLVSAYFNNGLLSKDEVLNYINQLIRERNGHHLYLCILVNPHPYLDIPIEQKIEFIYRAIEVAPENMYFWGAVAKWIDTYFQDWDKKIIIEDLYKRGCWAINILSYYLCAHHPKKRRVIAESWLRDEAMINNPMLAQCVSITNDTDLVKTTLERSTNPITVVQCLKKLGPKAYKNAENIVLNFKNENISVVLVSITMIKDSMELLLNVLAESQNVLIREKCLETLGRKALHYASEYLTNPVNLRSGDYRIILRCLEISDTPANTEQIISVCQTVFQRIVKEHNVDAHPRLTELCIEKLGNKISSDLGNILRDHLTASVPVIKACLKFVEPHEKQEFFQQTVERFIIGKRLSEQVVKLCLSSMADDRLKKSYCRSLLEKFGYNRLHCELTTTCLQILNDEAHEIAVTILDDQKADHALILPALKVIDKESIKSYAKVLISDPRSLEDQRIIDFCLDYIECESNTIPELLRSYPKLNIAVIEHCLELIYQRANQIIKDDRDFLQVYVKCLESLKTRAKYFAVRSISKWPEMEPFLFYTYVKIAGGEPKVQKTVQEMLENYWDVIKQHDYFLEGSLLVPIEKDVIRKERAKQILDEMLYHYKVRHHKVLTCALSAFWDKPVDVVDECFTIIKSEKYFIKKRNQHNWDRFNYYDGHVIKAFSNPCIRKVIYHYATSILKYNEESISPALFHWLQKISNGSFPVWSKSIDMSKTEYKANISDLTLPDGYVPLNQISVPDYFKEPDFSDVYQDIEQHGGIYEPLFITKENKLDDHYKRYLAYKQYIKAHNMAEDTPVPMIYCNKLNTVVIKKTFSSTAVSKLCCITDILNNTERESGVHQVYYPERLRNEDNVLDKIGRDSLNDIYTKLVSLQAARRALTWTITDQDDQWYYCNYGSRLIARISVDDLYAYRYDRRLTIGIGGCLSARIIDVVKHPDFVDVVLSRKLLQIDTASWLTRNTKEMVVLDGIVREIDTNGAHIDIGCGVLGFLFVTKVCYSRSQSLAERFQVGDCIKVAVHNFEPSMRACLSCKELLPQATDLIKEPRFRPGSIVRGVLKNTNIDGIYVELSPNLCGMFNFNEVEYKYGKEVSVCIKEIKVTKRDEFHKGDKIEVKCKYVEESGE